jgi:hypothetical protein
MALRVVVAGFESNCARNQVRSGADREHEHEQKQKNRC